LRAVTDILIHGDSIRSPELRHEVPVAIPDPLLYLEHDGRRAAVVSAFEMPRIEEVAPDIELIAPEELGNDDLVKQGLPRHEIDNLVWLRGAQRLGITKAAVPPRFPLELAELFRREGIELTVDRELFVDRRRSKNAAEIAGIRRAQRACEAAMDAARELMRRAERSNGSLTLDGEPLTSERLKLAIERVFSEHGVVGEEFIVSHGAQTAIGHEMGHGEIAPDEPIVLDLFPRDRETGCYSDMTRTFVVGTPSDELLEYHRLSKAALDRTLEATKPGVETRSLHVSASEVFEDAGYPTLLSKREGEVLDSGFFHSLGHGVGLEVHEQPGVGRIGGQTLVPGDVITLEPGCYRRGYGGVRLEDIVLVTEDGHENLTQYPYDLEP
jgi:Xaa-Pro aminopeptidase